jgi:hypothetical protein
MSILGNILGKIFSHGENKATPQTTAQAPGSTTAGTAPDAPPANAQQAPAAPMPEVDVEQVLTQMAQKSGQQLNWRTSIVDLLKLLDMDSSLQARKELAQELHYTGSTEDSAAMNIWLHKQVMEKIAANGGKIPADLHA